MKAKVVFLFLFALFLFHSCDNYKKEHDTILNVKLLVNTFPDSASHLLKSIKDPVKPGYDFYMEYLLLNVQLKDKLKQDITTDTNIILAVNYFIGKKKKEHVGIASFYAGKMYLGQGNTKDAMYYMLESKQYAEQNNDCPLLGLSCYYIGKLYKSETLYDSALMYFELSENYFHQSNDSLNEAYAIYEIADCFRIQDKLDLALEYYQRLPDLKHLDNLASSISTNIGHIYLEMNDLQQAKAFLLQAILQEKRLEQTAHNLLILSDIYRELGLLDSCMYYLTQSETNIKHSNNLFLKAKYFLQRSEINESNDDCQRALQDYKTYIECYDTLSMLKEDKYVLEMTQKYDAERLENHYNRQIIHRQYFLFAGFCITFICMLIISYYIRKNNRIKTRLLETELTMTSLTQNVDKYNEIQQKMKNLIVEKMAMSKRVALLKHIGNIDEKSMKKVNEIIYGEYINDFNWERLYQLLNDLYDRFVDKLTTKCAFLSESEIQFCCLLKAKYATGEIAFVMNLQIDSVRMKKMKIRKMLELKNREDIVEYLDLLIEKPSLIS